MSQVPPPQPAPLSYATTESRLVNPDEEHLRLLTIFHFIVGPIQILLGSFPLIHVGLGILMLTNTFPGSNGSPPPREVALMFVLMGSVFVLIGWAFGILTLYSGFQIRKRRWRLFSLIIAGINCIHFPFGTALGIFTLIVLLRRSVEDLYRSTARI